MTPDDFAQRWRTLLPESKRAKFDREFSQVCRLFARRAIKAAMRQHTAEQRAWRERTKIDSCAVIFNPLDFAYIDDELNAFRKDKP